MDCNLEAWAVERKMDMGWRPKRRKAPAYLARKPDTVIRQRALVEADDPAGVV